MGLLILRRKDSGTRNDFLGENSGPYILGKKKCTPGISGRQGNLENGIYFWVVISSLRGKARVRGLDNFSALAPRRTSGGRPSSTEQ